jgi:hypothetical protein
LQTDADLIDGDEAAEPDADCLRRKLHGEASGRACSPLLQRRI